VDILWSNSVQGGITVKQLSRKEKAELIAAAVKVIGAQKGLSPEARRRGLEVLQQAYIKHSDSRS